MKIKNLKIGEIPRIISVIHGKNVIDLAKLATKEGADLLEIRVDQLNDIDQNAILETLTKVNNVSNLPVITTIRSEKESDNSFDNYNYNLSQSDRLELYKAVIPKSDAVDIEFNSNEINDEIIKIAHKHSKKIILSYHDFKKTPSDSDLKTIINKSIKKKADIIKIATLANNKKDVTRLMTITSQVSIKQLMISISLGSIGAISRIIAPLFGSCITYGYIGSAPVTEGQLNIIELKKYFKLFYK